MERAYVYLIRLSDGGVYVGKTIDPDGRLLSHRRKSCNERIRRSIAKHGSDSILFDVIETVEASDRRTAESQAYELEQFWVAYLNFLGADIVNQNSVGLGSIDPSAEARRKMSDRARGNKRCAGRKLSEETRQKISAAARNPTDEQRRKMSEAAARRTGERNSFFGRKHTPETKEKISRNNGSRKCNR